MLIIDNLNVYYGKVHILKDLSLKVNEGEVVTILGSNGAGKTTLMMTIAGILKPKSGTIKYYNQSIENITTKERINMGIVLAPQEKYLFTGMTVQENLELGSLEGINKIEYKTMLDEIYNLFPILFERRNQKAGLLSGGEQQMLTFGRALMSNPKYILLDEPTSGLAPKIIQELGVMIKHLNKERKLSVLLAEQNVYFALNIADKGYIIENGQFVKNDSSQNLLKDEAIKKAYLGV